MRLIQLLLMRYQLRLTRYALRASMYLALLSKRCIAFDVPERYAAGLEMKRPGGALYQTGSS